MRKSAHMLRPGMLVVLDGRQRTISDVTAVRRDGRDEVLAIACSDGSTFNRTPGAKVEVIGGAPVRRRKKE